MSIINVLAEIFEIRQEIVEIHLNPITGRFFEPNKASSCGSLIADASRAVCVRLPIQTIQIDGPATSWRYRKDLWSQSYRRFTL